MNTNKVLKAVLGISFSLTAGLLKAQTPLLTGQDSIVHVKGLQPYAYAFTDTAGNTHSLKEFAGRYTYIDMWASWCYPCRKEYPLLRKLAGEIDTTKVQVVSISIDVTPWRWRGAMDGYHMQEGTHWLVKDTAFAKAFEIDRIPRFILLDKAGKVLNYNATRPSNEATLQLLKDLK